MKECHDMVDHEMHLVFHVLEDCADKIDENQALDLFQRKLELFSGESLFSMEESNEITLVVLTSDEEYAAISLLDEYCRELIHSSSPYTSISSKSGGDENWENEFSLLVPHEEKEAPIGVHDELMNSPFHTQQKK